MEVMLSDGRIISIKELMFLDTLEQAKYKDDTVKGTIEIIKISTGLPEEDLKKLTLQDGMKLIEGIRQTNPMLEIPSNFQSSKNSETSGK